MRISAFQKKNNLGDRITQSNGINRASEEDNVTITSQRSEADAENKRERICVNRISRQRHL